MQESTKNWNMPIVTIFKSLFTFVFWVQLRNIQVSAQAHTYLGPFPSCLELFCIWPHILADLAQGRIDPDCPTLFLKCLCQQLALRHYFCHHLQRLIVFRQYHLQLKREKKIIDWNRFFPGKPISKAFWNPNWFIPRKGI